MRAPICEHCCLLLDLHTSGAVVDQGVVLAALGVLTSLLILRPHTHRAKLLLTLAAAAADILAAEHFRQQSSMPAALLQRISSAIRHTKSACPQSTEVLAHVVAAEHNMSLVVQKFDKQVVAQRTLALLQHEE